MFFVLEEVFVLDFEIYLGYVTSNSGEFLCVFAHGRHVDISGSAHELPDVDDAGYLGNLFCEALSFVDIRRPDDEMHSTIEAWIASKKSRIETRSKNDSMIFRMASLQRRRSQ
ncbi:hypothetical protein NDI76_19925 [Halogeometricum sp. S1BR25-6]|uniref:Uncharacterized protein n=1 Tax=Halogeometricum salsisoli TaxID=2950536 RepID=A0ABU2GJM3_9EURY|nr:hypothetical protein [Halogeometricum sp. S1BR25-6]MDS0301015.1 hypothetical protein [Halogeometricum sp. S1BR25-6]